MTKQGRAVPEIVSQEVWQAELEKLLVQEKELTRHQDAVNAARRRLPMVAVESDYVFEGEQGRVGLLDLFEGRRQLIVYHFMFGPDREEGCEGCSWVVDAMSHPAHLHARDTSIALISRGPLEKLTAYKARMGWQLPWYSSFGSEFNYDLGATTDEGDEHGASVLLRQGESVYRTYYTGRRGVEHLGSHWTYLDLTPFGRQESWEDSPAGWPQTEPYGWMRRHDDYPIRSD
jgi:predicted dithiol-disulfide oxidoreductase (DUF899 family)